MPNGYRAARLLLSSEHDILNDGLVIVDGQKITYAGSWHDRPAGDIGPDIEDLGDVTLMPGLFDCHVHLVMNPGAGNVTTGGCVKVGQEELAKLMTSNALKLLDAGVTTARDLGCPGVLAVNLRNDIARGDKLGPRLLVSNAPITVPGGHACSWGGEASGVENVRQEVRKRIAEGANVIKVMTTGGFMTFGSHPSEARYSIEELSAIREEAHAAGLKVTTHAQGTEGIRRAVEAGLDSIEHCSWSEKEGTRFNADIARQIVERDVAVCPTMNTACTSHCYFCPWDAREAIIANLKSLREAGARMIVGTDAGIPLCFFERYADGLDVLLDAGYSPREILHSATKGAAYECGLADVTGVLRAGLDADLAAFPGNPLEDISVYAKPAFVMARGRRHTPRPIAPLGDVTKERDKYLDMLRSGANMKKAESPAA